MNASTETLRSGVNLNAHLLVSDCNQEGRSGTHCM